MKLLIGVLVAALLAASPFAAGADEASRLDRRAVLFDALSNAADIHEGQLAEQEIWAFWAEGPTPEATDLLAQGMSRRTAYDLEQSERLLDELVTTAPDFAEGWNQRAFTRFLRDDLEGSLSDIDETLAREPLHFGALAGQVQIYFRQGRAALAQKALRRALTINPWLRERALLAPDAPKDGKTDL